MKKFLMLSVLLGFACLSPAEEPGEGGLDYGDYKSVTLMVKAWGALDEGRYEDALKYTAKCVGALRRRSEK
ncbi:MAG: hypothetical protein OEV14_00290 [Gammaproteobacteria bacterium]|nr:hypothetical protein [Gammaproteobacteria bacterium]